MSGGNDTDNGQDADRETECDDARSYTAFP